MDHVKAFGTLLTDLSTVFDCLPHSLFIAKLKAYDFNDNSLKLVNDYLSHRFQRTKIGSEHSSWKEIILDVPQCSRPLFFNINLCDLLFIIEKIDIASFSDGNAPYVTGDNISSVVKLLEEVACGTVFFQWFKDNEMKANADKFRVLLSTSNKLVNC